MNEKKKGDVVISGAKSKKASDIAKDMERWAKRQNKEKAKTAKQSMNSAAAAAASMATQMQESKTADAGFAALERKMDASEDKAIMEAIQKQQQQEKAAAASATAMIASYGGDSDEEDTGNDPNAGAAVMPTAVVPDRCRGEGCKCPIGTYVVNGLWYGSII